MKKLFILSIWLFCLSLGSLLAQTTVTGKVLDDDGLGLVGASVLEVGTTNGVLTGEDGGFSLKVKSGDANLQIAYIGMETVTEAVAGRSVVSIRMTPTEESLEAVVITALGFKAKRDELGSTISIVDKDAIGRSGETGLINGLSGKASNVQITRGNGDPGAGSSIRIRGANTILGDSDPLIIVDGVPLNNSTTYGGGNNLTGGRSGGTSQQSRLNDINPGDIQSVQVLKGASAAALWGSRAANGVIIITTKNGSIGKPKIAYKGTMSFDVVSERIPMQTTWGQGSNGRYSPTGAESWGDYIPDRSGGADVVNETGQHFISESGKIYYPITEKNSRETYADKNWDDVIGTGGFRQHDFSISGGSDKNTYFFSLGRVDQEGIVKNSFYDRTNVRFNNKAYLNKWLSLSTKASYTNSNSNRIQQSSNTAGLMLGLMRTAPDFDGSDYKGTYVNNSGQQFVGRHRSYRRYLGNAVNPTYNNARWTVEEQTSSTAVNRFVMTPQLNITPVSWLQIILRGNADLSDDKRVFFFPIGSGGDRSVGIFAEDIIGRQEYNFDGIAKGNFNLSDNIGLQATLGWSINDRSYRRNSGQITGFQVNATKETTSLNSAATNSTFENFKTFSRSNRGYGVLNFDLFDQLFVNLSGGLEASSTIKDEFFYPAVDVAWNFTKTLVKSEALSFGKLRASWGKVGVQPRAHAFQTLAEGGFVYSTYSDDQDIALWGGGFRIDNNQGNPNLQPEIKTEFEVGADLRFLEDKLSYSVTYYQNSIEGILLDVDLSPSSGFSTKYGNFGSMENKGIEMDLNWAIVDKDDFSWNFYVNFARNRNLVTDLRGTESIDLTGQSVSSRAVVGYPLGVLFGTGAQTNEDGTFILDDNGFPQTTASPIVLGDPNPDWRGGAGMNFMYKNLGLNLLIEHSQGGDFSPRSLWVLRRFGTTEETAARVTLDRDLVNYDGDIVPAGTTLRGTVDNFGGGDVVLDETWYRHGIGGGLGDNQLYNFSIKDATYTKVRELTLSYTINGDGFQKKTSLGGITLSATGRNLISWDNIEGVDPETNQFGVGNGIGLEYFTNPQTASFLFSLGVNF